VEAADRAMIVCCPPAVSVPSHITVAAEASAVVRPVRRPAAPEDRAVLRSSPLMMSADPLSGISSGSHRPEHASTEVLLRVRTT
jgi:hypothetical protein